MFLTMRLTSSEKKIPRMITFKAGISEGISRRNPDITEIPGFRSSFHLGFHPIPSFNYFAVSHRSLSASCLSLSKVLFWMFVAVFFSGLVQFSQVSIQTFFIFFCLDTQKLFFQDFFDDLLGYLRVVSDISARVSPRISAKVFHGVSLGISSRGLAICFQSFVTRSTRL